MLILPSPTCGWATVSVQTTGLPTLSVLRLDRPVPRQPQDRDATARLLRRGRCLGFRCISPAILTLRNFTQITQPSWPPSSNCDPENPRSSFSPQGPAFASRLRLIVSPLSLLGSSSLQQTSTPLPLGSGRSCRSPGRSLPPKTFDPGPGWRPHMPLFRSLASGRSRRVQAIISRIWAGQVPTIEIDRQTQVSPLFWGQASDVDRRNLSTSKFRVFPSEVITPDQS